MTAVAHLVAALHAEGRPRVWSLIVTILGDAARPRGGWMASARLAAVLDQVDVNAGAMRAALSRLTRDGWLVRSRDGRTSAYRVRPDRAAEEAAASQRIYAPPQEDDAEATWILAVGPAPPHAVVVAPGVALWPAAGSLGAANPGETVRVVGHLELAGPLPLAPALLTARQRMRADLAALAPEICARLSPVQAMAARTLLIHRWRRLVLRDGDLPPRLEPESSPGLRAGVADRYERLLSASEAWLDQPGPGYPPMPVPDGSARHRFERA